MGVTAVGLTLRPLQAVITMYCWTLVTQWVRNMTSEASGTSILELFTTCKGEECCGQNFSPKTLKVVKVKVNETKENA